MGSARNSVAGPKKQTAGRLARHTVIYGLGSAITAAGGFILIPLYTNTLTTTEYGLLEILNRIADIVMMLAFLGTRQAYIRFFFDKSDLAWHKTVTSTTISFSIGMALTLLIVCAVVFQFFPDLFLRGNTTTTLLSVIACWIPFEVLFNVSLTFLRVNVKSTLFVAVNAARLVAFVSLNIVFLYVMDLGVTGIFLSQLIATGVIGLGFLGYFATWSGFTVDRTVLREMLYFGLPYLPAAGFSYIIANADRFFLNSYYSLSTVGLYALGSKIGTIGLTLFMKPFEMVWSPYVFAVYKETDGNVKIGRAFTVYTAICTYLALGVALAGPIIIRLIAESQYQQASIIVPIVSIGAVLYGMATLIDAGVLISKKTKYKPAIFGAAAAGGLLFHTLLTVPFGLIGASIASTMTFGLLFVINYRVSERFYHVVLIRRDFLAILASALSSFFIFAPLVSGAESLAIEIVYLTGAALFYPSVFLLTSSFSWSNMKQLFKEMREERG